MVPYEFKLIATGSDHDPQCYHVQIYVGMSRPDASSDRWRLLGAWMVKPEHVLGDPKEHWRSVLKQLAKSPF